MLSKQPDIKLAGEAENGKELVELTARVHPHVIITDVKMPLMDGIEATRYLTQHEPDIGIISLSMFDEEQLIIDMLEAGAKGYLLKNADKNEVVEAIKTVYGGEPFYCKHTSIKLAQMIATSKFNPRKKNGKAEFTERETEIISLICQQYTNKEIGEKLYLSSRTVEGYRLRIQEKMDVKNIAGLVIYAIKNRLFVPE